MFDHLAKPKEDRPATLKLVDNPNEYLKDSPALEKLMANLAKCLQERRASLEWLGKLAIN